MMADRNGVVIVSRNLPPYQCGVGDHSAQLGRALADTGLPISIFTASRRVDSVRGVRVHAVVRHWRTSDMFRLARLIAHTGARHVIIQYVPHLYSPRHGVSASIPILALLVRLHGMRVVTVVHEPYVRFCTAPKELILGAVQRLQLLLLAVLSCTIVDVRRHHAGVISVVGRWRRVRSIPNGSNIPVRTVSGDDRRSLRHELGVHDDDVLLIWFGKFAKNKRIDLAIRTLNELRERNRPVHLLVLGETIDEIRTHLGVGAVLPPSGVRYLGYQTAEQSSALLHAADLMLAPYTDGVHVGRTAVIAALAHGLPVVTTATSRVEAVPFNGAVSLVSSGEDSAFILAVDKLTCDPTARRALGAQGKKLHDEIFTWQSIARDFVASAELNRAA